MYFRGHHSAPIYFLLYYHLSLCMLMAASTKTHHNAPGVYIRTYNNIVEPLYNNNIIVLRTCELRSPLSGCVYRSAHTKLWNF